MLFSVIIPTYNRAQKVKAAVQSILTQSYQKFEIIVVDDGGTDNTESVIKELNDIRVKYYWKENEERSIARNYGIDKSNGDYIAFLDSDDFWYANHLSTAFESLKHSKPPVLHTSFRYITESHETIKDVIVNEISLKRLLRENYLTFNSGFIRRDIMSDYRFIHSRDAIISEDYCLWIRLVANVNVICSSEVTTIIVQHTGRSLNNIDPVKVDKSFKLVFNQLDKESVLNSSEFRSDFNWFKASHLTILALFYSIEKKKQNAFKCLMGAVKFHKPIIFTKRFLAVVKKLLF